MPDTKFNFMPPCLECGVVGKSLPNYIRKKMNAGTVNKLLPFQLPRTEYPLKHNFDLMQTAEEFLRSTPGL